MEINEIAKLDEKFADNSFPIAHTIKNIKEAIGVYDKIKSLPLSKEVLSLYIEKRDIYEAFLNDFEKIVDVIGKIFNDIEELKHHRELINSLNQSMIEIENILNKIKDKNIAIEYNIDNIKDIITIGKKLKEIKKGIFKLFNENYLKENFTNELESLKHNIKEFRKLKKELKEYLDIQKVEKIGEAEAKELENIIVNDKPKKIIFFSLSPKEYKNAINKINNLLKNKKSKVDYKKTANNIKNYIVYKNEIENNQEYKDYFSSLFKGTKTGNTNIKKIDKLHKWLLKTEEELGNKNLINIIISQDNELFETITQNIDSINNYLNKFKQTIDEIKHTTNAEYISHLFNEIDNIDFISLKNSLEQISNYLYLVIKKADEIKENKENVINLLKDNTFNELRDLVKKCSCTNANIYKDIDNIEEYANKDYIQDSDIDFTEEFYQELKEKKEILEEIESIEANEEIKEWVLENKDSLDFLDSFKDLDIQEYEEDKTLKEIIETIEEESREEENEVDSSKLIESLKDIKEEEELETAEFEAKSGIDEVEVEVDERADIEVEDKDVSDENNSEDNKEIEEKENKKEENHIKEETIDNTKDESKEVEEKKDETIEQVEEDKNEVGVNVNNEVAENALINKEESQKINIENNKEKEKYMVYKTVRVKSLEITGNSLIFSLDKKETDRGMEVTIKLNNTNLTLELSNASTAIKSLEITGNSLIFSLDKKETDRGMEVTININNSALTLELLR